MNPHTPDGFEARTEAGFESILDWVSDLFFESSDDEELRELNAYLSGVQNTTETHQMSFLSKTDAASRLEAPGKFDTSAPPLVVLTRNSPSTFYEGPQGLLLGFEHDLAKKFATYLKRPVVFKVYDSQHAVLKALEQGHGDFAAAGLSVSRFIPDEMVFSPDYLESKVVLVCRVHFLLEDLRQLNKDLVVPKGSFYEQLLKDSQNGAISYRTVEKSVEDLLVQVSEGEADCTLTGRHVLSLHTHYLKSLSVVYELPQKEKLAWVFPIHQMVLRDASEAWFKFQMKSGTLRSLVDRYFGHDDSFDSYDIGRFLRRMKSRLPQYLETFKEAEKQTGMEWELLASLSYQESHWDARARSATGVRGLMMLTLETAAHLGVSNRLNPEQSILGGARHLKTLFENFPDFLSNDEKTWMALAAYNVGFGHLQDARALAVWRGKNPNSWHDLQEVLPLLSHPVYLPFLRHGTARGYEPVEFVARIRNYQNILRATLQYEKQHEKQYEKQYEKQKEKRSSKRTESF